MGDKNPVGGRRSDKEFLEQNEDLLNNSEVRELVIKLLRAGIICLKHISEAAEAVERNQDAQVRLANARMRDRF